MPERPPFSEARENTITRALEKLARLIARLQRSLTDTILDFFFDRFDTEDRNIKVNPTNFTAVNVIQDLYDDWNTGAKQSILKHVIDSIIGLQKNNSDYFSSVVERDVDGEAAKVFTTLMKRLGYDPKNQRVTRGGYLDAVLNSDDPVVQLKLLALRSIVAGESLTEFKKKVEILMKGIEPGTGLLEKHYGTHLFDVFQQYDREVGRLLAEALGLKYAIYQGGLIKTSRPFCIERNDKVFTAAEIALFGTKRDQYGGYENKEIGYFRGKPPIYNPFLDLGGYRCRHVMDWLSNELGEILRLQQDAKTEN